MVNVESGHPLAAAMIRDGQRSTLCVLLHHLAADGHSVSLLMRELRQSLGSASGSLRGARDPLGYYDWSNHLHACVKTGHFDEAASLWRDQVVRSYTAGRDWPHTTGALRNQRTRVVVLEPDDLRSLLFRRNASKLGLGVPVLVLAAFAKALCSWLGAPAIPVRVIGHGRQPIAGFNPIHVVGWCSGGYPLVLAAPEISPVEHIQLGNWSGPGNCCVTFCGGAGLVAAGGTPAGVDLCPVVSGCACRSGAAVA